jgi:hypothetical protein
VSAKAEDARKRADAPLVDVTALDGDEDDASGLSFR